MPYLCTLCEECDALLPSFTLETLETDLDLFLPQGIFRCWWDCVSDLDE